jgi:hypothetical protein
MSVRGLKPPPVMTVGGNGFVLICLEDRDIKVGGASLDWTLVNPSIHAHGQRKRRN